MVQRVRKAVLTGQMGTTIYGGCDRNGIVTLWYFPVIPGENRIKMKQNQRKANKKNGKKQKNITIEIYRMITIPYIARDVQKGEECPKNLHFVLANYQNVSILYSAERKIPNGIQQSR